MEILNKKLENQTKNNDDRSISEGNNNHIIRNCEKIHKYVLPLRNLLSIEDIDRLRVRG